MLVAFSVAPSGAAPGGRSAAGASGAADSVSVAVAEAIRVVRASGLPHHTDAMFTTIEGDWASCMEVVRRAVDAVAPFGTRVSLVLKADIRPGHGGELTGKVDRVEALLGTTGTGEGPAAGAGGGSTA
ncbi:MAG TPA: thiamine-binding protein [Kineosporiaceae bacterium]|nr:thiamine-binding protein [Kineosporiaceae bacterium]